MISCKSTQCHLVVRLKDCEERGKDYSPVWNSVDKIMYATTLCRGNLCWASFWLLWVSISSGVCKGPDGIVAFGLVEHLPME